MTPRRARASACRAQRRELAARASGTDGPRAPVHPRRPRSTASARPGPSGSGTSRHGSFRATSTRTSGGSAGSGPKCSWPRSSRATTATRRGRAHPAARARSATASRETGGSVTIRSSSRRRRRSSSPATSALAWAKPSEQAAASSSRYRNRASPTGPIASMLRLPRTACSHSIRQVTRAPSRSAAWSGSRLRPSAASIRPMSRNSCAVASREVPGSAICRTNCRTAWCTARRTVLV